MCCLTNCKYKIRKKYPILDWLYYNDIVSIVSGVFTFFSAICVIVSLVAIIGEHITADSYVATNNEKYESLFYKLESEKVRDEFGLLNKAIVDEIQEWNEDLAYKQSVQDNFWIGIYYPNVYDQFEKIELK